jgi:C1A family cysteine protease
MISRWLVGIVAGASLLGARAGAGSRPDFDQGVDVSGLAGALQEQAKNADGNKPFSTYSVSGGGRKHAKGFRKHAGGKRDYKKSKDINRGFHLTAAIPDAFDLRPKLTQIEDQGQCGGCWAFSLTATNRDGHALDGNDPGRLSQEWLIEHAKQANGCNGGDFDAADNLIAPKGEPLWDKCEYQEGSGKCAARLKPADNSGITAWHMLGDETNGPSVQDIETEIAASGKPVSIAIAAGAGDWEKYTGGVYNGCVAGAQLDHMINIVGWDNQGAAFDANGNLPAGKGVWILRNSWGASWGENGYMRTQMTDANGARCNGVAQEAAYFDF